MPRSVRSANYFLNLSNFQYPHSNIITTLKTSQQKNSPIGRIGCVPYLNAKPLIYGIRDPIKLEVPALLIKDLKRKKLEAALIPVAEYLECPSYQIIPGISIACRGPVRSVYLAHQIPISRLQRIALDPSSKTSNLLLQVILAEFYGLSPQYKWNHHKKHCDARLLIGDPALLERENFLRKGYRILDLGEVWQKKTGLPFVFAVWAIRKGLDVSPYFELFTKAKKDGLRNLEAILSRAYPETLSPNIVRKYLTRNIYYNLGPKEIRGLLEFQRLCIEHGLIARKSEIKLTP